MYFDAVADYPAHIINWHDREAGPSLSEASNIWRGAMCGGLSRTTLVLGDRTLIRQEALDALAETDGRRLLLSTGCVAPIITPYGNLMAARQSVEAHPTNGNPVSEDRCESFQASPRDVDCELFREQIHARSRIG